tara:strand:- start:1453 stop:1932 length:480 start_codon:yes stop_codon:yes gene_type:complete
MSPEDAIASSTALLTVLIALVNAGTVVPKLFSAQGTALAAVTGLHTASVIAYWFGFVRNYALPELYDVRDSAALYAVATLPALLALQCVVVLGLARSRGLVLVLVLLCLFVLLFLVLGLVFVSVPAFPDSAVVLFFLQLAFAVAVLVFGIEFGLQFRAV